MCDDRIKTGRNIIFLISQPRAGSTMLQRMLGAHQQIHTGSEPWIMLHPLYAMKNGGIQTEYNSTFAKQGLFDFLGQMEDGSAFYREKLREMYTSLYGRLLGPTGKIIFLDKTPRYYFVIKELYDVFPDAKFIILLRNPLAVLASIADTWTREDREGLSEYQHDLLLAPDCLLHGLAALGNAALKVNYEAVVEDPEKEIRRICRYAGVDYAPGMVRYGDSLLPRWPYGDQTTVYEKGTPDAQHAEKWIAGLASPEAWHLTRDYLDYLGAYRLAQMGYSYPALDTILKDREPKPKDSKKSRGLAGLLAKPAVVPQEVKPFHALLEEKNSLLEQMERQLQEIRNSRSFRLGRILLRPWAAAKKKFNTFR